MRQYAFEAVHSSKQMSESVASTNMLARIGFRTVLSTVNAVPPLGNAMFKRPSEFQPAAYARW